MNAPLRHALLALAVCALLGCNSMPRRDPAFAASYPAAHASPQPAQAASGAIYQRGYDIAWLEDVKARRIGDILTVRLEENNRGSKSSETTIDRQHSSSIENPTILGSTPLFDLPAVLPLASTKDNTLESSLSGQHEFGGEADADISNALSGNITVTVADVLPNGNLYVRGEKRLNINQGNEYIKIAGIVRPIDIASDNSVASNRIADATLIYSGDGATADANRMGWLSRFFVSSVFPF